MNTARELDELRYDSGILLSIWGLLIGLRAAEATNWRSLIFIWATALTFVSGALAIRWFRNRPKKIFPLVGLIAGSLAMGAGVSFFHAAIFSATDRHLSLAHRAPPFTNWILLVSLLALGWFVARVVSRLPFENKRYFWLIPIISILLILLKNRAINP